MQDDGQVCGHAGLYHRHLDPGRHGSEMFVLRYGACSSPDSRYVTLRCSSSELGSRASGAVKGAKGHCHSQAQSPDQPQQPSALLRTLWSQPPRLRLPPLRALDPNHSWSKHLPVRPANRLCSLLPKKPGWACLPGRPLWLPHPLWRLRWGPELRQMPTWQGTCSACSCSGACPSAGGPL